MWRLACILVLGISGCALSRSGPLGPRAAESSVPDPSARVVELLRDGTAALEGRRWTDAAKALGEAHGLAIEPQRKQIAFFWAFALYQQGAEIARSNLEGDLAEAGRARAYFLEARTLLQQADHPLRDSLSSAIDLYLVPARRSGGQSRTS